MRDGWTPKLRRFVQRADPGASIIAEVIQAINADIKDLPSEYSAADSTTGFDVLDSGGARLAVAANSAISHAGDDLEEIPNLSRPSPFFALLVELSGAGAEDQEVRNFTARLHPKADAGTAKDVVEWRACVYRVETWGPVDTEITTTPISRVVAVAAAGVSASDITFDFWDGAAYPRAGAPPVYHEDFGGDRFEYPYLVVKVWGVQSDGIPATNTAWLGDTVEADGIITGTGWKVTAYNFVDGSSYGTSSGGNAWLLDSVYPAMPRFTLNRPTYTAATITWTTNPVTFTVVGSGVLEITASGQVPAGTSITYEIHNGVTWDQCYDGDLIGVDNTATGGGDLTAVSTTGPWSIRATLTPDGNAYLTPAIKRFGVREIVKTDLTGVCTVEGGQVQVDPMTLKGEITSATIKILKTGERDYRDYGTEILTASHIGEIELRVWLGDPTGTYLDRSEWMLLHSFEVEDYVNGDTSHDIRCVSPMRRLRRQVPPYVVTSGQDGTREPTVYTNQTPKAVYSDLLTNLGELPGRYIGPGVEDATNTVTKTIYEADLKDEVDRVCYISGYGMISSQGRIKAVEMMRDGLGSGSVLERFLPGSFTPVNIGPGYGTRTDEFFVPYGWDDVSEDFDGEIHVLNSTAVEKLGGAGLETTDRLDEETAKWVDTSAHATLIAKRVPHHFGNGLIVWGIRSTYANPHLEPGDPVVVVTDQFAARSPITDQKIRGLVAALGLVSRVGDLWGRDLDVWVPSFDDIIVLDGDVTRLGYKHPAIQEVVVAWDGAGAATARVRCNIPDTGSVRMIADDTAFNTGSIAGQSPEAVDATGYAEVALTGTWVKGQTLYLAGLAYETAAGAGKAQVTPYTMAFPVNFDEPRLIVTLDLDGVDLYLNWTGTSPIAQIRYLVDVTDAPTEGEVQASANVDSTGSVLVHSFDPDGDPDQTVYVGYIGETAAPLGVTSLAVRPATYKVAGGILPTVELTFLGRTTAGAEKWIAVASGAKATVALYLRTYTGAAPAYTRTPGAGYSTDPLVVPFTFAHPADGGPNVIIEAYAEDEDGLVGKVVRKESDSDIFPSGDIDLTSDTDNEAYLTPRTIDTDSLSYRFKVTVSAKGSDAYADPSLVSDADLGVATLVGTGFGTQVKLSAVLSGIAALTDDEEIFVSGWMFNTATTTAAAQGAAIKSSLIRRSIPAGFIRNALNSVWLETRVQTFGIFSVIVFDLHYQCATDAVKSLLIVTTDGTTPTTTREDLVAKDGVVEGVYAFTDVAVTATVTPYDDISADLGTGNAGASQETTLTPGNESVRTILTDQDGSDHITDTVTLASRGLTVGDDSVTGKANIGIYFDAGARGMDLTGATNENTALNDLIVEAAAAGGGKIFVGGVVQFETLRMMKGVEIESDGWNGKLIQKANAHTVTDSGTSTGGNTTSTLNDTGKVWTVDEHKMRTLHITSGPLLGETRVIVSNTATQLTVGMESGVGVEPFSGTPGTITYEILTGSPMVVSDDVDDGQWGLRNIRLDGNKANQVAFNPGVLLEATPASVEYNDSHHFLVHVLIDNVSGWGLLHGLTCRETSVIDVIIRRSARHNIFTWPAGGTDNSHVRIISAHSGLSGIVANGTNDRYVDVKSFGCGQDAVVNQGHGWLITAQGVHGTVLQAQENEGAGFSLVDATDCQLDIRSSSNQDAGLAVFRALNCNIRMQAVGDEGLLYVQPWAVIDTGGPTADPSTNNRLDLVTDDSHSAGVVDPDFQDNDNTIHVNNRTKGKIWSTWGSLGTQHEHLIFGKDSAPAANEPQYAFKTESDTPSSALFESYDGTNTRTYFRFKHTAQELILGYAARVTQVTLDGARLILGTPSVAASGVPVENIGLKLGYYLYGEQTYFGGSWVKLIGFFSNGTLSYVDLSPGAYPVHTGGQINAGNVVSVFRDTGEAFRFGKAAAPASGSPYYSLKHDAGSPPLGRMESYDGTTTRTYMSMDHANDGLTFMTAKMGFFSTAAVAKPTGVAVTAAGIHAALTTLGLIS